jgi:hypothetical protein
MFMFQNFDFFFLPNLKFLKDLDFLQIWMLTFFHKNVIVL